MRCASTSCLPHPRPRERRPHVQTLHLAAPLVRAADRQASGGHLGDDRQQQRSMRRGVLAWQMGDLFGKPLERDREMFRSPCTACEALSSVCFVSLRRVVFLLSCLRGPGGPSTSRAGPRYVPCARRKVVEPNQVDVLAAAVFRGLEQVLHAAEAGLARQIVRDVRDTNSHERIDHNLPFVHAVSAARLDVRPRPDANAAPDPPALNPLPKTFGEHHDRLRRKTCVAR
jgi:hypothetical protein